MRLLRYLLRWLRPVPYKPEYKCIVDDCPDPPQPWDGPFCTNHTWADT